MRSPVLALACASLLAFAPGAHAQITRPTDLPLGDVTEPAPAPGGDVLQPGESAPDEALQLTPRRQHGDVPYVIVTNRRLAPAFEPFAQWKSAAGTRAAVRTVEWIHARYAGRDDAERVREFLKDAAAHWHTHWLLVGGDSTVVPMRLATVRPLFEGLPDAIPTDWYYACLGGDWDGDHDGRFGERPDPATGAPGDSADLTPELNVGRAPVATRAEAREFLRRTRAAYAPADADFARSTLLAAGALNPGAVWGTLLEPLLPPLEGAGRVVRRLYEFPSSPQLAPGADSCGSASLLAALSGGPSLAVLAFNTGVDGLATRAGIVNVTLEDLRGVSNGARRGHAAVLGSFTCSPGAASVARTLLLAPAGGLVSCYGPTEVTLITASAQLVRDYAARVAAGTPVTLGEASSASPAELFALQPGAAYAMTLLGDPQLHVPAPPAPARLARDPRPLAIARLALLTFASRPASPVRDALTVRWSAPAGVAIDVDVFDVTGRHVQRLASGADAAASAASWDLRGRDGSRVAAGVYLVRAAGGGQTVTERVVVLP